MQFGVGLMLTVIYSVIPIIWASIAQEEGFFCKQNYFIYFMLFLCIFSLTWINWTLIKLLEILFDMKLNFKMNIMCMLDP